MRAKAVVNATGPFCDGIRKMDDPKAENVIVPSSGTHIVLPEYFSPKNMGLLDPSTSGFLNNMKYVFFLDFFLSKTAELSFLFLGRVLLLLEPLMFLAPYLHFQSPANQKSRLC